MSVRTVSMSVFSRLRKPALLTPGQSICPIFSSRVIERSVRSTQRVAGLLSGGPPPSAAAAEGRGAPLNPPTASVNVTAPQPVLQPQPQPVTAEKHFQNGEKALLNRNFPRAAEQFQLALDHKDDLDDRHKALSHFGLAIAMNRPFQAQQIGRQIERRWPGDPDFEQIRAEFREGGGRGGRRPRP